MASAYENQMAEMRRLHEQALATLKAQAREIKALRDSREKQADSLNQLKAQHSQQLKALRQQLENDYRLIREDLQRQLDKAGAGFRSELQSAMARLEREFKSQQSLLEEALRMEIAARRDQERREKNNAEEKWAETGGLLAELVKETSLKPFLDRGLELLDFLEQHYLASMRDGFYNTAAAVAVSAGLAVSDSRIDAEERRDQWKAWFDRASMELQRDVAEPLERMQTLGVDFPIPLSPGEGGCPYWARDAYARAAAALQTLRENLNQSQAYSSDDWNRVTNDIHELARAVARLREEGLHAMRAAARTVLVMEQIAGVLLAADWEVLGSEFVGEDKRGALELLAALEIARKKALVQVSGARSIQDRWGSVIAYENIITLLTLWDVNAKLSRQAKEAQAEHTAVAVRQALEQALSPRHVSIAGTYWHQEIPECHAVRILLRLNAHDDAPAPEKARPAPAAGTSPGEVQKQTVQKGAKT